MPTGWSRFIHHYLVNINPQLTHSAWQVAVDRTVLTATIAAIDSTTCEVRDDWACVASLLERPTADPELLTEALMAHAALLRKVLTSAGAKRQNASQLRTKLRLAVDAGLGPVPTPTPFFPRLWTSVADELAAVAFEQFQADRQTWRAYAKLSLAGYVQTLTTSDVSAASRAINYLTRRSVLGMRGAVTRLPHAVVDRRIVDQATSSTSASWHSVAHRSRFLIEVDGAITRVRNKAGFVSCLLDANAPLMPEHKQAGSTISPAQRAKIREAVYLQYDSLVIGALAYSGIEQILRSRMKKLGLPHRSATGRPYSVSNWIRKLSIPNQLETMILAAYDPKRENTRNRLLHSCLNMVDAVRPEIVRSIQHNQAYSPRSHYPESIARQATHILNQVTELWSESDIDLQWTTTAPMEQPTVALLETMRWELDDPDVLAHQDQFRLFADNVAPSLSTLFKGGMIAGISGPPIEQLASMILVFEGLLRHTCDLVNIPTVELQGSNRRFFTNVLMLDEAGLLSPNVVDIMLGHLTPSDRPSAQQLLRAVAAVRNLFAHGGIRAVPARQRELFGRATVKLAYLFGSVGLRHMIEERAYHLHLADAAGEALENWVNAEADIFSWLRRRLVELNSLRTPPSIPTVATR